MHFCFKAKRNPVQVLLSDVCYWKMNVTEKGRGDACRCPEFAYRWLLFLKYKRLSCEHTPIKDCWCCLIQTRKMKYGKYHTKYMKFLRHMTHESALEKYDGETRGSKKKKVNVVQGLQSIVVLQTHKTVIIRLFLYFIFIFYRETITSTWVLRWREAKSKFVSFKNQNGC